MLATLALGIQIPKTSSLSSRPQAELRIRVDRASVGRYEDPGFHVTIRNVGKTTLRLSDIQEASDLWEMNPKIDWITPDLRPPESLDTLPACGNYGPVNERFFFTLAPGQRREVDPGSYRRARLRPGVNWLSLDYRIEPQEDLQNLFGFGGDKAASPEEKAERDRITALYRRLTPIHLTSNVVRVTLKTAS